MLSFFFSSRRRHTRFDCDWSSDVCSSDLDCNERQEDDRLRVANRRKWIIAQAIVLLPLVAVGLSLHQRKLYRASAEVLRSEERRVGKGRGAVWWRWY